MRLVMASFLARYWRTIAVASVSLTSSYLYSRCDQSQLNNRLLTVHAAEQARRPTGKALKKHQLIDDDDDEDDDEKDKEGMDNTDESISSAREKRFRSFASIEYDGEIYMTPADFLESVVADQPRPRIGRRQLTADMVDSLIYSTPPKHRGSKKFFRQLEDAGLISYSEYLFLWVVLTKPANEFEIAFSMFDIDGNQLVDKYEFLVLERAMGDKRMSRRPAKKRFAAISNEHELDSYFHLTNLFGRLFSYRVKKDSDKNLGIKTLYFSGKINRSDTTLLLHFFGKNGRDTLNYAEFKRFTENLQKEVLEIEFNEFSHGFKTISDLDFAELLLRYTDLDSDTKKLILKSVKKSSDAPNAITFEQFEQFFSFLNNLEEFSIAMRFHQLSDRPISHPEFQRAVRISTGFELDTHMIGLIFRIFDVDSDQHLSYDEFMAVMKDRLSRGFRVYDPNDTSSSKFDQFKRCLRERAKYDSIITLS